MKTHWADEAWEDYLWWHKTNGKILQRINRLIESIQETPFNGLGKPEPLKHELSGYWSRRITNEHRLVYKIADEVIVIVQCRYHY
ncbi:MAG: Txe/YoeB family addiction module toxin [Nitrosomonadales bacterium]|nr:Txe/YoeB family addiction module toxin [Nitrosomonadales bacterium]